VESTFYTFSLDVSNRGLFDKTCHSFERLTDVQRFQHPPVDDALHAGPSRSTEPINMIGSRTCSSRRTLLLFDKSACSLYLKRRNRINQSEGINPSSFSSATRRRKKTLDMTCQSINHEHPSSSINKQDDHHACSLLV
jgi:hypothetical protein